MKYLSNDTALKFTITAVVFYKILCRINFIFNVESGDTLGGYEVRFTKFDVAISCRISPSCIPLSPSSTAFVAWLPPIRTLMGDLAFSFEYKMVPSK
jgi:hypothetical protein